MRTDVIVTELYGPLVALEVAGGKGIGIAVL
jgi:hypothetical protein